MLFSFYIAKFAFSYFRTSLFKQIIHLHGTSSIEKQCIHSDYRKLDISHPSKFSSLKQFEKYLLHHEKAQVVINNNCGAEQKNWQY